MNKLAAPAIAECIGVFALTFVGGGSMLLPDSGLLSVALAHGIILAVMVCATLHISGGQINPAVSIALSVINRQPWDRTIVYIIAQLAGAIAAAALIGWLMSTDTTNAAARIATVGNAQVYPFANDALRVFTLETIATFLLMTTILGSAVDARSKVVPAAGFAIGLCVAALVLCFGPLTGASMNPARTFGPALVGGVWNLHWVYWAAPIAGATLAALLWQAFILPRRAHPQGAGT